MYLVFVSIATSSTVKCIEEHVQEERGRYSEAQKNMAGQVQRGVEVGRAGIQLVF